MLVDSQVTICLPHSAFKGGDFHAVEELTLFIPNLLQQVGYVIVTRGINTETSSNGREIVVNELNPGLLSTFHGEWS